MAQKLNVLYRLIIKSIRWLFVLPIVIYQKFVSPLTPDSCLYHPSCSEYTRQAILRHGVVFGIILGSARLLRCNAWFFKGGEDPIPERFSFKAIWLGYKNFYRKKSPPNN